MNKNLLKINLLKSYPLKMIKYVKIMRSQYIMCIQEKYGIEIKLLLTTYFSIEVALDITISNDNEYEPQTIDECQRRNDWPMWKEVIQVELNLLSKREVFGPVV